MSDSTSGDTPRHAPKGKSTIGQKKLSFSDLVKLHSPNIQLSVAQLLRGATLKYIRAENAP